MNDELALLGAMMLRSDVRNAAMDRRITWTGPETVVARVYNMIVDLALNMYPTDVVSVAVEMRGDVSPEFLHRCIHLAPVVGDPERFVAGVLA